MMNDLIVNTKVRAGAEKHMQICFKSMHLWVQGLK